MIRNSALAVAAVVALSAFDGSALTAQTTFEACRVPDVGAIYMINVAGAPTACLDASHVAFSWTEGGVPGPGSITSNEIADGTIVEADIAVDGVTGASIAPAAVGSTEILDGSINTVDLGADALPAGVDFNSSFANFDPVAGAQTAGSVSVDHPGSGFIISQATGQINCSSATQTITLGIANGTTSIPGGWIYTVPAIGYTMVFAQAVLPVTGVGTADVNFNVNISGGDSCTYFRAMNIDAVYVPNRY